jgi:ribosomal protein S18 acetylase RimI-like enzyme
MVKVRVMVPEDWYGIAAVWENHEGTNPVDDTPEGLAKYLRRNPTTSFVAVDGDRIIGTILAGHDGRRGIFHHVSVLSEYQKQGVGKMLVDAAMKALRAEGINKVLLVVFDHNKNGNEFWEHMGFTTRPDLIYRNKYTGV